MKQCFARIFILLCMFYRPYFVCMVYFSVYKDKKKRSVEGEFCILDCECVALSLSQTSLKTPHKGK